LSCHAWRFATKSDTFTEGKLQINKLEQSSKSRPYAQLH